MLRLINKMKGCDYCQEVDNSEVGSWKSVSPKNCMHRFRVRNEREISFKSKKVKGNRQRATNH